MYAINTFHVPNTVQGQRFLRDLRQFKTQGITLRVRGRGRITSRGYRLATYEEVSVFFDGLKETLQTRREKALTAFAEQEQA